MKSKFLRPTNFVWFALIIAGLFFVSVLRQGQVLHSFIPTICVYCPRRTLPPRVDICSGRDSLRRVGFLPISTMAARGVDYYLVLLLVVVAVMVQWAYAWKAGFSIPPPGKR